MENIQIRFITFLELLKIYEFACFDVHSGLRDKLKHLRKNVWDLMQVIVPDLELDDLEMVDQVRANIVMIRLECRMQPVFILV